MTTFELTSRRSFSENELYNDIMAQKIPGMTEPEFFRFLSLSNDGLGILYPNSKLATLNRIRSGNEKLAPLYIYYCKDSEEALNLVERAEKSGYDTLEIMIKLETVSRGSKVNKKVEELAKKLSTDRILTFLINYVLELETANDIDILRILLYYLTYIRNVEFSNQLLKQD